MARGNDAAAALADLRGEFAGANGSAEDLIAGTRAAWSPELRHANKLQRDQDDEGNLVAVDLDKIQSKVGDAGTVLDAAKRGPFVVAVVETESGRTYKDVFAADEVGFTVHKRDKPRSFDADPGTDQGERDALLGRMGDVGEAKRIEAEAEKAAQEAREKVYEAALKSRGSSSDAKSSGDKPSATGK